MIATPVALRGGRNRPPAPGAPVSRDRFPITAQHSVGSAATAPSSAHRKAHHPDQPAVLRPCGQRASQPTHDRIDVDSRVALVARSSRGARGSGSRSYRWMQMDRSGFADDDTGDRADEGEPLPVLNELLTVRAGDRVSGWLCRLGNGLIVDHRAVCIRHSENESIGDKDLVRSLNECGIPFPVARRHNDVARTARAGSHDFLNVRRVHRRSRRRRRGQGDGTDSAWRTPKEHD